MKWFHNPDWWMVILTVFLFVVGAITLVVFYGQFKEMQTQTGILSDQANRAAADAVESGKKVESQLAIARQQAKATQDSVLAISGQARIAEQQLELSERPWVKIKNNIASPLTFDVGGRASGIPVAMAKIEDTIENVGQSVAVDVLSWEDVIPIDPDHSLRTARARQKQWCDANRHPDPRGLSGYTLFPRDPIVQNSTVGPQMPRVVEAEIRNDPGLTGKVAFVLVGCVCYRSSFDPKSAPTHQTRFIYYLGVPESSGGFQPYIVPQGTANDLRLIAMPDGFTAD
jgi:hypothetical protein